jgi:hypothetical protein
MPIDVSRPLAAPLRQRAAQSTGWTGLTGLALAVALAACGGGGGGSPAAAPTPTPAPTPPSPPPPPPPPPAAASYFVAAVSSSASLQDQVEVIDPANPAQPVLSVPIGDLAFMTTVAAASLDVATRTSTYLGAPRAVFIKDRQLMEVNLSKPGTPAAVRVSSLTDVCGLDTVVPIDTTGTNHWYLVRTAGDDGSCATPGDFRHAFVRSGSANTAAATVLPAGVQVLPTVHIADNAGQLLWIPAIDSRVATAPKLVAFNAALAQSDVAGGAGVAVAQGLTIATSLSDGVYLRADNTLRRLTGTATSLSLAPANYTFTSIISGLNLVDGSNFYFSDGPKVLRVQGANAPTVVATLPADAGDVVQLTQTATRLLATHFSGGAGFVSSIRKSDGAVVRLLSNSAGSPVPAGLDGETLYYHTGNNVTVGEFRRMQTDGTGDALVRSGVYPVGGVNRTTLRADFTQFGTAASVASLYCVPLAGAADCRTGSLVQHTFATGNTVVLGSFSGMASAPRWYAAGVGPQGLQGGVLSAFGLANASNPGYSRRDVWLFNPGQANSLVRSTQQMP